MIIANKYKILEKIGDGEFGSIYRGENIRTQEYVAIKIEAESEKKLLKNESRIYYYLGNISCIPSLKWFGKIEQTYFMVIQLLGNSLTKVKRETKPESFSLNNVLEIGKKIISILEVIHSRGIIHQDIKPDNFLFSQKDYDREKLYLIDFGFSKRFLDAKNNHIPLKGGKNIIGTPNFISINIHNGLEASRRDDLESVIYLLLYLYLPILPWNNLIQNQIKDCKSTILANNIYIPKQFKELWQYIRHLNFEEKPDYNWMQGLMKF